MSVSNLKKLFDHFDFDHNGFMDYGELKVLFEVLRRLYPGLTLNDSVAMQYFQYADANKDNKLSFDEFLRVVTQTLYPGDPKYEQLRAVFNKFDRQPDEKLTRAEFKNFIKAAYGYMNDPRFHYKDQVADYFLGQFDKNMDGNISFDEFYLFINGVLKKE